ncbi:hypothetical protein A8B82_09085 [Sulfitobacter sp. EhC04]|nr:hypothetical protein A8B82_09085 [Sulfitobacter sp. EhC04]
MVHDLERLQNGMTDEWLRESLPEEWTGLDYLAPVPRPQTRITLRLDGDMVKWFRRMGPGYQKRINLVLRIYYQGLISGQFKAYPNDDTVPRLRLAALAELKYVDKKMAGIVEKLNRIGRGEE